MNQNMHLRLLQAGQPGRILAALVVTFLLTAAGSFSAFAAPQGTLDRVSAEGVGGWAADDASDTPVSVVLVAYADGTMNGVEIGRGTAAQERTNPDNPAESGPHGFLIPVDWESLAGNTFQIEAYAEENGTRTRLYGTLAYEKPQDDAAAEEAPAGETYVGSFTTTAYCSCKKCCPSGSSLTYAGTVPTAGHTISADLSRFPLGTKLRVGDTVYTVEDCGSAVKGNVLDIYFPSHSEALQYGRQTADVYRIGG